MAILEGLLPESRNGAGATRLIMGMQALHGDKLMTKKEITILLNRKFLRARFEDLGGHVYLITATKQ